jgi:RHS repeat-associated protein
VYAADFGWVSHTPTNTAVPSRSDQVIEGFQHGVNWQSGIYKPPSGVQSPSPYAQSGAMNNSYLTHCLRTDCGPGTAGSPADGGGNRVALYEYWPNADPAPTASGEVNMRGSRLWLADYHAPALSPVSRSNPLSGWADESDGPQTDGVTTTGSDGGLGVSAVEIDDEPGRSDGDGDGFDDDALAAVGPDCDGLQTGEAGPCPSSFYAKALEYSTEDLSDGINTVRARAVDIAGNVSAEQSWEVKLDKTGPSVTLNDAATGDLYERQNTVLPAGSYTLYVHATDGSTSSPSTRRSGVKAIEVYLGYPGQTTFERVDSAVQSCPADSCAMNDTWVLNTAQVAGGQRTVKVVVTDQVGNKTETQFNVTVPASATLLKPFDGARTSKLLAFQVKADVAGLTNAQLQYRRPLGTWQNVPTSAGQLTDQNGVALGSSNLAFPTATVGATTALVNWNATAPFALGQADGPLQVRAVVTGGVGGTTKTAQVTIDERGLAGDNAHADIGPGSVDLVTGNFSVGEDDVSLATAAQTLTVSRTFNSRNPSVPGPFGPGWVASLPVDEAAAGYASIAETADPLAGNYTSLVRSDGTSIYFYPTPTGGYDTPPGYEDLKLTKPTSTKYRLVDGDGNTVVFESLSGATEFRPTQITVAGTARTSTISYKVVSGKLFPTRIVAAPPTGVASCANPSTRGCRSLDFVYAGDAGATGVSPAATSTSEAGWGSYTGRLDHINMTAWDPATSAMQTDSVAKYLYDSNGMLRMTFDPRIDAGGIKLRYTYDAGGRLNVVTPPGEQVWSIAYSQLTGDSDGGRLASVTRPGTPQGDATSKVSYGVPLSGAGVAPYQLGASDVVAWGQTDVPADATAIFTPDALPAGATPTVAEYQRAAIHYLNATGKEVNTASRNGGISTAEYDRFGNVVRELTPTNRQRALLAGAGSAAEAQLLDTERVFTSDGRAMTSELGPRHSVKLENGTTTQARHETTVTYDEGAPPSISPKPYLPTTTTERAKLVPGSSTADARMTKTEYDWSLRKPTVTIVDPAPGLHIRRATTYDSQTGNPTQTTSPITSLANSLSTRKTLYYTADAPAGADVDCINRPEWADLPCKTKRGAQSGELGLPQMPVRTFTYNRLDQVVQQTEKVGSMTRVKTLSFDAGGRSTGDSTSVTGAVRQGLVAAYGFDEGSGYIATDASGKNNPGSISGAVRAAAGKYGGALTFDGVNDLVTAFDSPSLGLGDGMTIEAWVKNRKSSGKGVVLAKGGPSHHSSYSLAWVGGGYAGYLGPAGGTTTDYVSNYPSAYDVWVHLAATYDGERLNFYRDGNLVDTKAVDHDMLYSSGSQLRIGAEFTPAGTLTNFFQGDLDEVRIYDRPLSGPEVQGDMAIPITSGTLPASTAPEDAGLAAGYDMSSTGGTAAYDVSGQGNDATLVNGPSWVAGGLSFDGTNDYAEAPDAESLDVRSPLTLATWITLDTLPAAGQRRTIVAKPGSYYLQINSSGQLVCGIDPTGAQAFLAANEVVGTGPALGTSTYVACTFSGTALTIYKGAAGALSQIATKSLTATAAAGSAPLRIGAYTPTTSLMDGKLSKLRVWARTFTLGEFNNQSVTPGGAYSTNDGGTPVRSTVLTYYPTSGKPKTIQDPTTDEDEAVNTTVYDNIGRPSSYTDAEGNTSTTSYDVAGRVTQVTDGKGTQTFTYDSQTGLLASMVDSQAGTFGATYDLDGGMLTKTYPGGLAATVRYDESGSPIHLDYAKGTTWFAEDIQESIHGQWLRRDSNLSDQDYTYDKAGRLTQVTDTPAGGSCTTRSYAYDKDSNRTNRTVSPCGGSTTSQNTYYDGADRMFSPGGFAYDSFSRLTTVPASHAGGQPLQTGYYENDMVRSQTQDGVTTGYLLDADKARYRATLPNGPSQTLYHYSGGSDSPDWSAQVTNGAVTAWDRNVGGIDGDLAAIAHNDGTTTTVTLQLENLHGDITATALSTSTSPTATFESDEFGNPKGTGSRTYQWLGSKQRAGQAAKGVIQMGVRSYVPDMGRFTSIDPIEGGSTNDYDYSNADPVNGFDPDGRYTRWHTRKYSASYSDTLQVGSAGSIVVTANIRFNGRDVITSFTAIAVGPRARVGGVDIFCREEHFPRDNGCGHRLGVTTTSGTFTLNDDANYHLDFKFHGIDPKTGTITFGGVKSPQFSCRKGRRRGRRCEFN